MVKGTLIWKTVESKVCFLELWLLFEEPISSHNAGLYVSSPSWNLLLSSPQSRPLSLSTPFKRPLFSMALRERYGRTSSTGPNGTYLYTAYPSLPESKMRKILVQWLKAIPVNHWSELWRLGSMPWYILWLFWFVLDFSFKCLLTVQYNLQALSHLAPYCNGPYKLQIIWIEIVKFAIQNKTFGIYYIMYMFSKRSVIWLTAV